MSKHQDPHDSAAVLTEVAEAQFMSENAPTLQKERKAGLQLSSGGIAEAPAKLTWRLTSTASCLTAKFVKELGFIKPSGKSIAVQQCSRLITWKLIARR